MSAADGTVTHVVWVAKGRKKGTLYTIRTIRRFPNRFFFPFLRDEMAVFIIYGSRLREKKKISNSYFKRLECFSKNIYVAFCMCIVRFCTCFVYDAKFCTVLSLYTETPFRWECLDAVVSNVVHRKNSTRTMKIISYGSTTRKLGMQGTYNSTVLIASVKAMRHGANAGNACRDVLPSIRLVIKMIQSPQQFENPFARHRQRLAPDIHHAIPMAGEYEVILQPLIAGAFVKGTRVDVIIRVVAHVLVKDDRAVK